MMKDYRNRKSVFGNNITGDEKRDCVHNGWHTQYLPIRMQA